MIWRGLLLAWAPNGATVEEISDEAEAIELATNPPDRIPFVKGLLVKCLDGKWSAEIVDQRKLDKWVCDHLDDDELEQINEEDAMHEAEYAVDRRIGDLRGN